MTVLRILHKRMVLILMKLILPIVDLVIVNAFSSVIVILMFGIFVAVVPLYFLLDHVVEEGIIGVVIELPDLLDQGLIVYFFCLGKYGHCSWNLLGWV